MIPNGAFWIKLPPDLPNIREVVSWQLEVISEEGKSFVVNIGESDGKVKAYWHSHDEPNKQHDFVVESGQYISKASNTP